MTPIGELIGGTIHFLRTSLILRGLQAERQSRPCVCSLYTPHDQDFFPRKKFFALHYKLSKLFVLCGPGYSTTEMNIFILFASTKANSLRNVIP